MKISKEINDLIVQQISNENRNTNAYLQIASWFEEQNLSGFGSYFKKQAEDEIGHKNKLIDYLNVRTGGKVKMLTIPEITLTINSLVDVGSFFIQLEEQTTTDINRIIETAFTSGDYMTFQTMQWFINEQIEEENKAIEFLNKAKLIDGNGTGIVLWDSEING